MKSLLKKILVKILKSQVVRLLRKNEAVVIGITGSVGKTSTKLAIAQLLKTTFKVHYHKGNYNSEVGLPLSLFSQSTPKNILNVGQWLKILISNERQINSNFPYEVIILEMGADHPGNIQDFMEFIHPDIGVLTAASIAHTDKFKTVSAILKEKWSLVEGSKFSVINIDQENIKAKVDSFESLHVTYGLNRGQYTFNDLKFDPKTGSYTGVVTLKQGALIKATIKTSALHSLSALLAATAVADHLEVPVNMIKEALEGWRPSNGRMNILPGVRDTTLIDDTYNSSPMAAIAAIDTLEQVSSGRKIVIMGSMNELGDLEESTHREVGSKCSAIDLLVTIGESAKKYIAEEAILSGLDSQKVASFDSPVQAGQFVRQFLQPGDTVLIKGSQNKVYAEEATKILLDSSVNPNVLVRQSDHWLDVKKRQFPDIALLV